MIDVATWMKKKFCKKEPNVLVIGKTGSGMSRCFLAPTEANDLESAKDSKVKADG